jgi:hypothetical protein
MALPNSENILSRLEKLPDAALKQMAMMHKADPYILPLIISEDGRRKRTRQAAQSQMAMAQPKVADAAVDQMGIAQLQAPNLEGMADGGIAGYDDNDFNFAQRNEPVVRMSKGGPTKMSGAELFEKALDMEGITDPKERAFLKALHAQESSGKTTAKTSNRDARGAMQILPTTFKQVADKDMDINKPLDNMRAGIRYGKKGYDAAGGDPVLAGAYYYGGPGGMKKAAQGVAVSDPKNPNAPDTVEYGKSIAQRMTAALPIGSAVAGEVPGTKKTPPPNAGVVDLVSQIPGSNVAPRAPGEKDRYITGNQGVIGAGETALQYLTGTLAIPTAGGAAVLEQVPNVLSGIFGSGKGANSAEIEKSFREKAAQVTYEPRTVGGKTVSESFGKTLEDLKIPPYLARIGSGASVRRPSAGASEVKALAKEAAATAAEKTKIADTLRLPPPSQQGIAGLAKNAETILVDSQGNALPPKTTPAVAPVKGAARAAQDGENVATGDRLLNLAKDKAEAAEARKTAEGWAKAEEATTKADAQNMLANERFGQTNRAQGVAALTGATPATISASNAATAAAAAAAAAPGYDPTNMVPVSSDEFGGMPEPVQEKIVETAKAVVPEKKGFSLSDEDYLSLGLRLMANKNPNFLVAAGESGLGALADKKEREKSTTEKAYREAQTRYQTAYADALERGAKEKNISFEAEKEVNDYMANWDKNNKMLALQDPTARMREEQRIREQIYASAGVKPIMAKQAAPAGGGGFKFLGVS